MRRRTIAVLTLALVALAGCSKAPEQVAAPAPFSSTPTVTTTRGTPTVEPTAEEPTPEPPVEETEEAQEPVTITCNDFSDDTTFTSMEEAWAYDGAVYECTVETVGVSMSPELSATAAAYLKLGSYSEGESQSEALDEMLGMCAAKDIDVEELLSDRYKPMVPFTLKVCPSAPHAKLMRLVAAGDVFIDGTYEVGVDVKPGTYRTEKHMTDCYWERSTKGGSTIANDFVSNAPAGVTVRIRKSDGGFKAERCGMWTRVR